jgi:hypothetical protein
LLLRQLNNVNTVHYLPNPTTLEDLPLVGKFFYDTSFTTYKTIQRITSPHGFSSHPPPRKSIHLTSSAWISRFIGPSIILSPASLFNPSIHLAVAPHSTCSVAFTASLAYNNNINGSSPTRLTSQ